MFESYSSSMSFKEILCQINAQEELASQLFKKAEDGNVEDKEAELFIKEMSNSIISLKATMAIFFEMHKDTSKDQEHTLKDAIVQLEKIAGKFKVLPTIS